MAKKPRPGDGSHPPGTAEEPPPRTRDYYLKDSTPNLQVQRSRRESIRQASTSQIPRAPPSGGGSVARRTALPASHCCPAVSTSSALGSPASLTPDEAPPPLAAADCQPLDDTSSALNQNGLNVITAACS